MNPTIQLQHTDAQTFDDMAREGGTYLVSYRKQSGTIGVCLIRCIVEPMGKVTVRSLDWESPHKHEVFRPHRVHGRVVIERPDRYKAGPNRFKEFMSYTIVERDGGAYHSAYVTTEARDKTLALLNSKENAQ